MVNNIKIIYNLDGIEVCLTADNFWGESTVSRQLGQMLAKVVLDRGYDAQKVLDGFKRYCEWIDDEEEN